MYKINNNNIMIIIKQQNYLQTAFKFDRAITTKTETNKQIYAKKI